ncbi:MAG: Non-specific serine/threonine protein kinase, partial [Chthoniobacteraceae bacterium]|nr:Non-specific serine/threonine protein kinase [Chthoniobacteraceae bacterium]
MLIDSLHESAARAFLKRATEATAKRGTTLFKTGGVKLTTAGTETFSFSVPDPKIHSVQFDWTGLAWAGRCSCQATTPCKHRYAAMLALLSYDPSQAEATPSPATFSEMIEARLGRSLLAEEGKKAAEIEEIYRKCGDSKRIAEYVLSPLLGDKISSWNYQMHEIWPSPPQDAWEAWLYLAAFLRAQEVKPPAFLASITGGEEIDALVADREYKKAIVYWRDRLRFSTVSADRDIAPFVKLRAVFHKTNVQLEWRPAPEAAFEPVKKRRFEQMYNEWNQGSLRLDDESVTLWMAYRQGGSFDGVLPYSSPYAQTVLNPLFRNPMLAASLLTEEGLPFVRDPALLKWTIEPVGLEPRDYELRLTLPDGMLPSPLLVALSGHPPLYVGTGIVYQAAHFVGLSADPRKPNRIPAQALETSEGVALLDQIGVTLPAELAKKTITVKAHVVFQCRLIPFAAGENIELSVEANFGQTRPPQVYRDNGWETKGTLRKDESVIERVDRSAMRLVPAALEALAMAWSPLNGRWQRKITSKFPQQFVEWLTHLSSEFELILDPILASLSQAPLTASLQLDVAPVGIDWFDLKVALKISDTELSEEELTLLMDANGQYVRLGSKGWRRLAFDISPEDEARMADIGINSRDFSSKPQRFHALQLANKATARLLSKKQAAAIERRAEEIQTRIAPDVPKAIQAELRPYQIAGFHFLAYLSTNRFGGILADDMGLGKTVQTLAWLAWLRGESKGAPGPSLVVCPKSVIDNWRNEANRFFPGLRVKQWRGGEPAQFKETLGECDLMVVNYAQLRLFEECLGSVEWHAAILDEAQFIKNPASQTARVACALRASHRLALSGTPIENRLLDLWSIMMFSMPGVLGARADFTKRFDQRTDPLARRRLSARVRPFVLRRTKSDVANDLPDRIEEDILCELEGGQAALYQAELKNARQQLLNLKTARQLDKARFNVLTSLLRLRQICCH